MHNKWMIFGMIAVLLVTTLLGDRHAFADELMNLQEEKTSLEIKKKTIQSTILNNESSLTENQAKMDEILAEIEKKNLEINKLDSDMNSLETIIIGIMSEIEELHNSIIGIENNTAERDIVLRERLRAMQIKGGSISYIDVLIGSNSFSDFIDRFTAVTVLLEADRKIMKRQVDEQEQLQQIKDQIDERLYTLKEQRVELEKTRTALMLLKEEKDSLIDNLEHAQELLMLEKKELQTAYEETYKMSENLEQSILKEQQRIYQNESKRITASFCYAGEELNKDIFVSKLKNAGVFADKGQLIIDIANKYEIDPVLMAAIALQETAKGTSNAAVLFNNPGGLMDPKENWEKVLRFASLEDGLEAMGKTLNRMIRKEGKVTIQELGSAYAPIDAANDPLGLNSYWVPNVTKNVTAFGGLTMNCEAQVGNNSTLGTSNGKWVAPTTGTFTSQFSWREDPFTKERRYHRGLDIANVVGTPIAAAGDGVVSKAGWHDSYGNLIIITHVVGNQVYTTVYAHLSAIQVQEGQQIAIGQLIGKMGSTGRSTGPHLHFEFHEGYYSGSGPSAVNPLRYVAF